MEPPIKRPRLGHAPYDSDDDDEICMEPDEFTAKQDPGYRLDKSRAVAALKLKSTFEHIFEKYDRDFSEIGDEIDLATGEIVVDNGHLRSMQNGQEVGGNLLQTGAENEDEDTASLEEEERILHGGRIQRPSLPRSTSLVPRPPAKRPVAGAWSSLSSVLGRGSRLSGLFSPQPQFGGLHFSFGSFGSPNDLVDPAWRAPDLPMPSFSDTFRASLGSGYTRPTPTRVVLRKALPMPAGAQDEDEDDILSGPTSKQTPRLALAAGHTETRGGVVVSEIGGTPLDEAEDEVSPEPSSKPRGPRQHTNSTKANGKTVTVEMRPKVLPTSPRAEAPKYRAPERIREHPPKKAPARQRAKRAFDPESDVQGPYDKALHSSAKNSTTPRRASDKKPASKRQRRKSGAAVVERHTQVSMVRDQSNRTDKTVRLSGAGSSSGSTRTKAHPEPRQDAGLIDSGPGARAKSRKPKSTLPREHGAREASNVTTTSSIRQADSPGDVTSHCEQFLVATSPPKQLGKERLVIEIVGRQPSPEPETTRRHSANVAPLTPEATEEESETPISKMPRREGKPSAETAVAVQSQAPDAPSSGRRGPASQHEARKGALDTFSRNELDPSYAFSDEEDGLITRKPSKPATRPQRRLPSPSHPDGTFVEPTKVAHAIEGDRVLGSLAAQDKSPSAGGPAAPTPETGPPPQLDHDAPGWLSGSKKRTPIRYAKKARQQAKTVSSSKTSNSAQSPASPLANRSGNIPSLPARDPSPSSKAARAPRTPAAQPATGPSPSRARPSPDGLAALVSDSDEDELSLTPQPASHRAAHSSGAMRKSTLKRSLLFGAHAASSPRTPAHPPSAPAGRRASAGASAKARSGQHGGGRISGHRLVLPHHARPAPSPAASLVRTPGGTVRRCGEDGFRCDRDFCFSCL